MGRQGGGCNKRTLTKKKYCLQENVQFNSQYELHINFVCILYFVCTMDVKNAFLYGDLDDISI